MTVENILAIDLGTQCGWAVAASGRIHSSGSESFHVRRLEGPGARFIRFRRHLTDVLERVGSIHAVYWEDVRRHSATDAAHAYGGFLAILTAWCELQNIRYQGNGIAVGSIKKFATGNGAARKLEMVAWAKSKGHAVKDDNEADALAILTFALARERGDIPLVKVKREKRPTIREKKAQAQLFEVAR